MSETTTAVQVGDKIHVVGDPATYTVRDVLGQSVWIKIRGVLTVVFLADVVKIR